MSVHFNWAILPCAAMQVLVCPSASRGIPSQQHMEWTGNLEESFPGNRFGALPCSIKKSKDPCTTVDTTNIASKENQRSIYLAPKFSIVSALYHGYVVWWCMAGLLAWQGHPHRPRPNESLLTQAHSPAAAAGLRRWQRRGPGRAGSAAAPKLGCPFSDGHGSKPVGSHFGGFSVHHPF